jgi:hypothetical protein
VPDKENTKYFTGTKKCGGEKIAQRALARLQFFGAQNARTGHFAVTVCYAMWWRIPLFYPMLGSQFAKDGKLFVINIFNHYPFFIL